MSSSPVSWKVSPVRVAMIEPETDPSFAVASLKPAPEYAMEALSAKLIPTLEL